MKGSPNSMEPGELNSSRPAQPGSDATIDLPATAVPSDTCPEPEAAPPDDVTMAHRHASGAEAARDEDGSGEAAATPVTIDLPPAAPADRTIAAAQELQNADFSLAEGLAITSRSDQVAVPGYEIFGELGRGGMGVVYKARQLGLNRWVALKMVLAGAHADERQLARFNTEAEAVARLQHPNIVQVYDIGKHDDLPYFSLEYVGGGSLDRKIHRQPQPPREAAHLIETLARAISCAHESGIIHRDLKPANVLLTETGIPKITDFGLAKLLEGDSSGQTRTGTLMGTPSYMAPEQARGDIQNVGPLADVHALGAMLYELLTGRPPFLAASVTETILQVTRDEPVPPTRLRPRLPRDLETICLKCLEKEPPRRYASALELAEDLRRFLSDEPIRARAVSPLEHLVRWCRRNPRVAALTGAVAVLLVTVAVGSFGAYLQIKREKAQTEIQRQIAEQKADEASKAQETATSQAQLAFQTAYDVVTKVDEELRDKAGMGPLRHKLLQLITRNLDQVRQDLVKAGKVDRTLGAAIQRMGTVYEQGGQTQDAIEAYQSALQIFEHLMAEHPDDYRNQLNAAVCYDNLGEMGREMEPDPAVLFDYYRKGLALRQALVDDVQNSEIPMAERRHLLSVSHVKLGTLYLVTGAPDQALVQARQALEQSERAAAAAPNDSHGRRIYTSNAHFLLGVASTHLEDFPAARAHLGSCRQLRADMVQAEPSNAIAKQDLAATEDALGDLEMAAGNYPAALAAYQRGHELFGWLCQKDPKNAEWQWYLSNSDYRMGTVQLALGKAEAAHTDYQACLKAREALTQADPNNPQRQIELMLARARCGRHEEAGHMAADVAAKAPQHPGVLFAAASCFALCSQSVACGKAPASLTPAEQTLEKRYAQQGLALLSQAIDRGYHDAGTLKHSPELESLRHSSNYAKLVNYLARG
jgi:serine/threonine-protein kinase